MPILFLISLIAIALLVIHHKEVIIRINFIDVTACLHTPEIEAAFYTSWFENFRAHFLIEVEDL